MAKKSSNLWLIIAFLVLAGLFAANYFFDFGKKERSFRSEFFDIDTATVNKITLYPKSERYEKVELIRNGSQWQVSKDGAKTVTVQDTKIKNTLATLINMKPSRVAATNKTKWAEYEIEDGVGTHVIVETDNGKKHDFYMGKFSANPQTRATITYVRLTGEDEVYACNGFFSMAFDQSHNQWRDNRCVALADFENVNLIEVEYPNPANNKTFEKTEKGWLLNGESRDSEIVDNYLRSLMMVNGNFFMDDFDAASTTAPKTSVKISGGNQAPLMVDAYELEPNRYVVISSQYSNNIFRSDTTELINRIFKQIDDL